ncbi:hypothetical protein AB7813_12800 [Tardiphaga sp. 20_F10_N6_6]|uniref:hypothetical protein n=1 Tax=Tardiphaga sp. 20_F10_N6_6 TaxID=3240788 RepID=UPI003F8B0FC7
MFKNFSGMVLIIIVALLIAQAFPVTGIFLMVLAAPLWTGLLVHVFLIALAVEAMVGRLPRAALMLPILAYGGYYGAYVYEGIKVGMAAAQFRSENSGKVMEFDPAAHSLVTSTAQTFISDHRIPVAYAVDQYAEPEGFRSFRLVRSDQCRLEKDGLVRIQTSGVFEPSSSKIFACTLSIPEKPPYALVSVAKTDDKNIRDRNGAIHEQLSEVTFNGQILGRFKTGSIWRLPLLPKLVIGCSLNSAAPAWQCGARFDRSPVELQAVPESIDRDRFDTPESVMLGIPKLVVAEFTDFRGYPENDAVMEYLKGEPHRVRERMFDLIKELAEGGYPRVPMQIGYTVATNPERLVPLAEAMANRFVELTNYRPANGDGQDFLFRYEGLARALAALPNDAFVKVAPSLVAYFPQFDVSKFDKLWKRAKEFAPELTQEFYEADFMNAKGDRRLFPALALCRIGRASPVVVDTMKQEVIERSEEKEFDDESKSALIVALIKLGQTDLINANRALLIKNAEADFSGWLDALLAGKGDTAVGPNNCFSKRWRAAPLYSSLSLREGHWVKGW